MFYFQLARVAEYADGRLAGRFSSRRECKPGRSGRRSKPAVRFVLDRLRSQASTGNSARSLGIAHEIYRADTAYVLMSLASCGWIQDIRESDYPSLDEARRDNAVRDDGPVPTFLPSSASNIRTRYDIDTNELWTAFDWSATDRGATRSR